MALDKIAQEIRDIISKRQQELQLSFIEESHTYSMLDENGEIRSDFPSVSKVIKNFFDPFPTEEAALRKAKGDEVLASQLIKEWEVLGELASNMGSRVHYLLEKRSCDMFNLNKELRLPEFNCDLEQMIRGDGMIAAGVKFLNLMKERGAVLLDTETVLGDPDLKYFGQPDKLWLMYNKTKTSVGLVITDYKTNLPKNFETNSFTQPMYRPFEKYPNIQLGHYYLQLPFYGKLFLKMLKGSEYENLPFFGAVIVLLKDDKQFVEYKVPKDIVTTIMAMDISKHLTKN